MFITIRHRGGFAGLNEEIARVDTARLDPETAKQVESNVSRLNLPALSGNLRSDRIGADFLAYEVTLDHDGRRNAFRIIDDGGDLATKIREFAESIRGFSSAA